MTLAATAGPSRDREAIVRRFALTDLVFRGVAKGSAILVLLILSGVAVSLVVGSWAALAKFGPAFLATESWNPVTENFGALAPIYGTVVTSAIAILIAVPVGIGIAVFLTELCPRPLRRPIGIAVELLAGIMIGDLTSPEALEALGTTTLAPAHGELILAFSPEKFAAGRPGDPFARAEILFETIVGQGARLPSQRRFAARAQSEAEGIVLSAAEVDGLDRLLALGLDAVD